MISQQPLTYLQQDNFDSALAVMDRLPVEFELGAKEISEKDRTKQYIGIVQGYRMDGRTKAELNADEQNALRNLRDGYYDRPAEWAQNILCFGYDICRPTLTGGDQRAQPRLVPLAAPQAAPSAQLDVYPNPAASWVTFRYDLQCEPEQAELLVRDATGRTVYHVALQASEQQQVWDTREVASGTYSVVLMNAGRELRTEKLIVKQ